MERKERMMKTIDAKCDKCEDVTSHKPDEFNTKVGYLLGKYSCIICGTEQQGDEMVVKTMAYLARQTR